MSSDDWNLLNRKVVGYIRTWMDDNVIHHVANETSAYALWTKLEQLYGRKTAENKTYLIV